ncbi:MAG TPA: methyltransferase dimerization domain-containing protein, partial [Erythrobacter sp.]
MSLWADLKLGYVARRNRVFSSPKFQHWAARLPVIRWIATRRAAGAFDLLAGFAYSQVLRAYVEGGLFEVLKDGPLSAAAIAPRLGLSEAAALTLLRAGRPLMLSEEPAPDHWMLGEQGAVFASNPGVQAMVRHHRLLYADLADPLALLRTDRAEPTALSR